MKKIISLLSISIVLISVSGCTLCRGPYLNEARAIAQGAGYVQSPESQTVMLSRRAAKIMAKNDPLMAMVLGVNPYETVEFTQSEAYAQQQFFQRYGFDPSKPAINLGSICWKEHPFAWPLAVAVDKGGPPTLAATSAGLIAWGVSEMNTGGGGSDDTPDTDVDVTGDGNTITINNNSGDGSSSDSHPYSSTGTAQ